MLKLICKKRSSQVQSGFTLIELMLVVAIISILATLALPRFELFQAKARFAEATSNIRILDSLYETYRLDNSDLAAVTTLNTGFGYDNGSGNSSNSCNMDNVLGFELTNCKRVNFTYSVVSTAPTDTQLVASAGGDRIYSQCGSSDKLELRLDLVSKEVQYMAFVGGGSTPRVEESPPLLLSHCN